MALNSLLLRSFFPRCPFDLCKVVYSKQQVFIGLNSQRLKENGAILDKQHPML